MYWLYEFIDKSERRKFILINTYSSSHSNSKNYIFWTSLHRLLFYMYNTFSESPVNKKENEYDKVLKVIWWFVKKQGQNIYWYYHQMVMIQILGYKV